MRVWVDIWNPTYTAKVGNGPLFPMMASVTRKLDEAGQGSMTFVASPRVLTDIQPRRLAEVWFSEPSIVWNSGTSALEETINKRSLGVFVIDSIVPNEKSRTITIKGPDLMLRLIDKMLLPGLNYKNQTVSSVLSSLATFAGWTVNADAGLSSSYISMRFGGGESVLRAMQAIAESQGIHLRYGTSATVMDAGAFGASSDLMVDYVELDGGEIEQRSDTPMLIMEADVITESSEIVNYVVGYGGGDGDSATTMELAAGTRAFVDSVSANGRTHYYTKDNASIALYGEIERRVNMKRIVPVDATDAAQQYASEAVADGVKAWLDRHSSPYEVLKLKVANVHEAIRPGQKIPVRYKGVINKNAVPYQWRDIEAEYWVMSVTESISANGSLVNILEVANIDRYMMDTSEVIVAMVDAIEVNNVSIQPYPTVYPWGPFQQPIDTVTDVEFVFPIFDNTYKLNSVKCYLLRDVWTAVASAAASGGGTTQSSAAGGDHRHKMFENGFGAVMPANNTSLRAWSAAAGTGAVTIGIYTNPVSANVYTADSSGNHSHNVTVPDHTHDAEFTEVSKDNQKPTGVSLTINSVLVASGLFPTSGGSDIAEVDITDAVKSIGDVRTWHDALIACTGGRGDISAVFLIDVDISKVRP